MEGSDSCLCSRPDIIHIPEATTCLSCGYTTPVSESQSTDSFDNRRSISDLARRSGRFSYTPLCSDDSIRLIRLYGGQHEEDIRCEIFHSSRDNHPEFEALSYVWGSEVLSERIYSTIGSLEVTMNCAAALRDLRYSSNDRVL
ncbi:hypothetical protein GGI43DRAFT_398923 [Trichoderma evansii]